MSRMDFSVNRSPLKTTVSKKVISFSYISAMNFTVRWNLKIKIKNKKILFFSVAVPKGENITNKTLPFSWLGIALLE